VPGTRQRLVCRRPFFAGCRQVWHPAKNDFAGCPIKNTRQIILHPANQLFPVVFVEPEIPEKGKLMYFFMYAVYMPKKE
jgi:hypothetical protein